MGSSEKIGQLEGDDKPDPTYAPFHMNRAELRSWLVQVTVRELAEDFCILVIKHASLVRTFFANGSVRDCFGVPIHVFIHLNLHPQF
jgi:hypothetical protein